jgi:hypothetical protein
MFLRNAGSLNELHGIKTQKIELIIATGVGTSNPTTSCLVKFVNRSYVSPQKHAASSDLDLNV